MYQNKIAQLQTHVVIVNITCNTMNPMKYTKTSIWVVHLAISYSVNKQILFYQPVSKFQHIFDKFPYFLLRNFFNTLLFCQWKKYLDKNLQSDGRCIHFHIYQSICYSVKYSYSNSNSSHIPD